ncbi:hypothetical protein [Embleya sp. NPDC005575]|uniref:hypothetical protein n=1 Tax=Embleya sp. NPDC005575 TaxID=3156892 RepID=UPI0033A6C05C
MAMYATTHQNPSPRVPRNGNAVVEERVLDRAVIRVVEVVFGTGVVGDTFGDCSRPRSSA